MRVAFIRPPKHLWPYINEQDNFLLSQAMVYLCAALREGGHEVTPVDCPPLRMGWASLRRRLEELRPEAVLAGDSETLFESESGNVFKAAKSIDPAIRTAAGGVHFSHAAADAFARYPIDAIVVGEGERTVCELLDAWESGRDPADVRGLALPGGDGRVRYTPPRPLIENLDDLPFPAFDLLPMEMYGKARYLFSPGGVTIHHSRGCVSSCSFCACWLQMASRAGDPDHPVLTPKWRTRSPGRVVEEIDHLQTRYGRDCMIFTDDTWNADADFSGEFAQRLLARPKPITYFAFFRYDYLARDEASGIFALLMRSGLRHICIGLERSDSDDLRRLNKRGIDMEHAASFLPELKRKYPELFLQATFIVGLEDESSESLDRLARYIEKISPDYPSLHPITPVPGTAIYEEAVRSGRIEVSEFSRYDWMTPVMATKHLSRDELEMKLFKMNRRYMRIGRVLRGLFSRHAYRRRMYVWWTLVTMRIAADWVLHLISPKRSVTGRASLSQFVGMIKPDWYER